MASGFAGQRLVTDGAAATDGIDPADQQGRDSASHQRASSDVVRIHCDWSLKFQPFTPADAIGGWRDICLDFRETSTYLAVSDK